MATNRKKFLCLDCRVDTGKIGEHYFVHLPVWLQAHTSKVGMLCIGCLEMRLGRELTKEDFPAIHVNDPKLYRMSERLLSRIK